MKIINDMIYFVFLSIVAFILLIIISFYGYLEDVNVDFYDRILILGLFYSICIFGITLAFYPRWYKKFLSFKDNEINNVKVNKIKKKLIGHHPDCDKFRNHIIRIKNKYYCAGCLGLAIGSVSSIIFGFIYLIFHDFFLFSYYIYILIGILFIVITYIEILFPMRNSYFHVALNTFFIIGFLLITLGILELSGNNSG